MRKTVLLSIAVAFFAWSCSEERRDVTEKVNDTFYVPTEEPQDTTGIIDSLTADTAEKQKEEREEFELNSANKAAIKALVDSVKLGFSWKQVNDRFSEADEIRPEGGIMSNTEEKLFESLATIAVFPGVSTEAEFNFKGDSLYSYYYTVEDERYPEANQLYQDLKEFFTNNYGDCTDEKIEEENHYFQSCMWAAEDQYVVMSYNVNTGIISFGVQAQKPF